MKLIKLFLANPLQVLFVLFILSLITATADQFINGYAWDSIYNIIMYIVGGALLLLVLGYIIAAFTNLFKNL